MAASSLIFGLVALAPVAIARDHGGTLVHSRFRLGEGDGAHVKAISDHHGRMLDNKNDKSKKKQDKKKREKQNKGPSKSRGNQRAPSANGQQAISRPSAMAPIPRPNRAPWSEAISLPQRPSLGFADSSITPRPTPRPTQRTRRPTPSPTEAPSNSPTISPSASPSHAPTSAPTTSPTGQPTESPTSAPSSSPTAAPTPLQYCPPAYDPSKTDYVAGDLVEVESYIFMCNDGQNESGEYLYERYCSIDDENSPLESEAEFELWDNAWPYVSACYRTDTPTTSPTTGEPTTTPSVMASNEPSISPSSEPSVHHSGQPSLEPSIHHSDQPSIHHSDQPSIAKSAQPSMEPSVNPTSYPSDSPTDQPTKSPSHSPTSSPSKSPTLHPTDAPTTSPTISEFWYPDVYSEENVCALGANFPHWMEFTTNADNYLFRSEADCCEKHGCDVMGGVRVVPTQSPSLQPTTYPPSKGPTGQPTEQPTKSPTASPTTPSPTANPTVSPSKSPSSSPTGAPTNEPTHLATTSPTTAPTTAQPSTAPSHAPSSSPTGQPIANSAQGTIPPTNSPTVIATSSPTSTPTQGPTSSPSKPPSNSPITTPICPDAYQSTSIYRAGSEVEVNQKIYRCKDYPWAFYCSQPNFRPRGPDSTEWQDAWSEEGPCEKAPSASPTLHPTPSPTRPITTRSPTNKPTPVPTPPPTTKQPTLSPTPDPQYTMFPYPYPHTRFTQWTKLSNQDKTTVYLLGYERSSWDNLQISSLESYPFSELDLVEQSAVKALGMNENQWDCFVNHYNGLYWSELEDEGVAQYYAVLGWSQNSWDNEVDVPDTESLSWDQLSASQREAARNLCYSKNAWDWVALPYW